MAIGKIVQILDNNGCLDLTIVKPVLSSHSKIGKTKFLKTDVSLMQVESIAECPLRAFCNTFGLHYSIIRLEKTISGLLLSGRLRQVLLYRPIMPKISLLILTYEICIVQRKNTNFV